MHCIRNVSSLDGFVKGFEQTDWWVGIDVHKHSYAVSLRRSDGQMRTWTSPADPQRLLTTFTRMGIMPNAIAQEAGPTGYDLARRFTAAGIAVIVGAPSRIPRPVTAGAKCDRLDCRRLAEYAARGMISSIAIPTVEEEAFRGLVRRRQAVTDHIRQCKQRIKAMLLYHDIPHKPDIASWSAANRALLANLELPIPLRSMLDSLLEELRAHEENQKRIDIQLSHCVDTDPVLSRRLAALTSTPGVGERVGITYLSEVFRPERFTRGDEVASYLELVPMVHHSGEKTPNGRIRPVGQRRLRSLLVEASWTWKSKDPGAQDIYARVLAKTGIAQKAIIAVARRLAEILWRLSIEQRPYYPMPIATRSAAAS